MFHLRFVYLRDVWECEMSDLVLTLPLLQIPESRSLYTLTNRRFVTVAFCSSG